MTNEQIIADIATSIYGEDAVMEMIENGDDIPLHTIKGWDEIGKRKGVKYKVRKGEHAENLDYEKPIVKSGEAVLVANTNELAQSLGYIYAVHYFQ